MLPRVEGMRMTTGKAKIGSAKKTSQLQPTSTAATCLQTTSRANAATS
jgi:hypothetical protein